LLPITARLAKRYRTAKHKQANVFQYRFHDAPLPSLGVWLKIRMSQERLEK
jgi:hypothetical protein